MKRGKIIDNDTKSNVALIKENLATKNRCCEEHENKAMLWT
jgi:hypothetical protein